MGDASQKVYGSTGALTVKATAANAGVAVYGASGSTTTTLEITTGGTVTLNGGDRNLTVALAAADVLTLPLDATVAVAGGGGGDTLIATQRGVACEPDDHPGGVGNTLVLEGGGTFKLQAPAELSGIQTVNLQGATSGQTVYLRDGLDLTVNVLDAVNVTMFGAANNDVVNLGAGANVFFVGGASETVNGGSGADVFVVTAANANATITGGSSTNTLKVQGGGTVVMGTAITGMQTVLLDSADYGFTANATAGLSIFAGTATDTITVGDASQKVYGSTGALTVKATAANVGVAVYGASGSTTTTLEITTGGTVTLNGGDRNLTVALAAADVLTLPLDATVTVAGGGGGDTLIATNGVLHASQTITLGGVGNTLVLQGDGTFKLQAPAALSGIQTVNLQGATSGQTVYLRDGLDLTVNVLDAANVAMVGAANDDVVNLGAGASIFYVGGTGETVRGGSGAGVFVVTAANASATITGGSGTNTLKVQGGGTVTMGSAITGMQTVLLDSADYNFTANAMAGLSIFAGTGTDTITVGDASQKVYGSTGALMVKATAANAGVAVYGASGSTTTTLEITTGGTVTLNGGDRNLTVRLDAAAHLGLGGLGFITAVGAASGGDTLTAGGANQTLQSIGGNDTLVGSAAFGDTFLGTSAGLAGDTIKGFGGSDAIDISDMMSGSTQPYVFNPATGALTVTDGTHSVTLTMSGSYTAGSFAAPASDGHGGTLIRFV